MGRSGRAAGRLKYGEDRAGLDRRGAGAKDVTVEDVAVVRSMEGDPERARQPIHPRLALERAPGEHTRKLHPERARRQTCRDDMEAIELFSRSIRHEEMQPHVAHDAREHQAPFARRVRRAVDRERAPGRLEDAPRQGGTGERPAKIRAASPAAADRPCSGAA